MPTRTKLNPATQAQKTRESIKLAATIGEATVLRAQLDYWLLCVRLDGV